MPGIEHTDEIRIVVGTNDLSGILSIPAGARGVVVFAHGSGSSRLSSRNLLVAARLRTAHLATLLFDLLTETEAADRANVFNIPLLADRLLAAAEFVRSSDEIGGLPAGYFGASTGAAAALVAAAGDPTIRAVVSRGGRPDLAGAYLGDVRAPTLLIVGGQDWGVMELNERAYDQLECPKRMEIIPGATHLFEEPGALDGVAALARDWFSEHLNPDSKAGSLSHE
jgi:putative phosphoribosyl transferase